MKWKNIKLEKIMDTQDSQHQIEITPTLFVSSIQTANERISRYETLPITAVQADVSDGQLIDELLLTPSDYASCSFGSLEVDFHLMVEEPLDYVYEILDYQEYLPVRQVIGQIERMSIPHEFIKLCQSHSWIPGISLDIYTPPEEIPENLLGELGVVQIMGNRMGREGQSLHPEALSKLHHFDTLRQQYGYTYVLSVDVGVSRESINRLIAAGATQFAIGSALWKSAHISQSFTELLQEANHADH